MAPELLGDDGATPRPATRPVPSATGLWGVGIVKGNELIPAVRVRTPGDEGYCSG